MPVFKDLAEKKFGRWTALNFCGRTKQGVALWLCRCDCGTEKVVNSGHLHSGKSRSCGCLSSEITTTRNITHGMSNTRVYTEWASMKQRCSCKTQSSYKYYGGRGIHVCKEWQNDFMSFYKWAISHGYSDDLSIDRIGVNGNYEPLNCRWILMQEQQENRSMCNPLTFMGKTYTIARWSKITKIGSSTISSRLHSGWSIEKTLTMPLRHKAA
jgi:hypothetical protein